MANVLTNLAADIYKAADIVAREHVGYIPAVTVNGDGSERVAKGGTVRSHFTRAATAGDRNQSMTLSQGTDQTIDNKTLTINKDRSVEIPWTGEDVKHVNNGSGFETIQGDQIAQAMRTLSGEIEADLFAASYAGASRAVGTAGTAPFASNLSDLGSLEQLFIDNGAPINSGQRSLIMNSAAKSSMYGLTQLTNVNNSGDTGFLRQGIMGALNNFDMRVSGTSASVTKGTGASYLVNGALSEGDTAVTVDTGSGTVLAGDVITFAGDTNKYVVTTALTGGVITLAAPGLRQSLADNVALTVGATYSANVSFERSAIELAVRAPALPMIGGVARDAAVDRMMVVDPVSGIPFEIAAYLGQGKANIQVAAAWGVKAWKNENINILLG